MITHRRFSHFKRIILVTKTAFGMGVALALCVSVGGCKYLFENYRERSHSSAQSIETTLESLVTEMTSEGEASSATGSTQSQTPTQSLSVDESGDFIPASTTSESTTATTTAKRLPDNPENMYSSYAFMKSFDPATGVASFDYFDMLKGQAAIDYLVTYEGYTPEDAATEVNDYADSEFVLKNVNPQLRHADMEAVSISMMYDASGVKSVDANTFALDYAEFLSLYQSHPDDVVEGDFFYYVTVSNDRITGVDQVYWP